MIPSPFYSSRRNKSVRLLIIHTAEGARTVESLGSWFQNSGAQTSSHAGIDDNRIETYVSYDKAAWTSRSANAISDNVELCGFANWSYDEWMRHPKMLQLTAQWIRERCSARNIPIRKLTPAQVAAGESGICGHVDWTIGMRDGSHTDPGKNFPWDYVISLASDDGTSSSDSSTYCKYGDRSENVMKLQTFMVRVFGSYNTYTPTGYYGDATTAGIAEFQRRVGITGPDADGTIVGPRTMAKLTQYGFQP